MSSFKLTDLSYTTLALCVGVFTMGIQVSPFDDPADTGLYCAWFLDSELLIVIWPLFGLFDLRSMFTNSYITSSLRLSTSPISSTNSSTSSLVFASFAWGWGIIKVNGIPGICTISLMFYISLNGGKSYIFVNGT